MSVPPDPSDWAWSVLAGLGDTDPQEWVIPALHLWAASEGMPAATFNWLAATDPRPGSRLWNSAGVQVYPSFGVGVAVLVTKFSSSLYRPIKVALLTGSMLDIYRAVNTSPWCHGCQNGRYPVQLAEYIAGNYGAGGVSPPVGPPPPRNTGPANPSWDRKVRHAGRELAVVARSVHGAADWLGWATRRR